MSPSQGYDKIAWYIIKIQLGSDNLWRGHIFGYVCTVTMKSEIWPWVKVMTHPSVIDNKCVKYYLDPTWQWGVMARTRISSICALWPWPRKYDNGSSSCHTLGSWTTIVWNIIQIQHGSEELWPGRIFPVYVHCDLDLGDMTLGEGHDTPLGHGQQLCELLSRSNLAVRSYGPDTDLQYICALLPSPWGYDLGSRSWHTLGSWTTIVWYYIQIGQGSTKLWPGHDVNRRTDRQTGWFLYTPPNFVCGWQTDRVIPIYPPKLCLGGGGVMINNKSILK